ncbi:MAG: class I SAM-dependent methyltransferase, partial [Thermodesulfobacteriota bacterium]
MNELTELIQSHIKRQGPITFCKFTELALYHKDFGYYTAGRERIGKKGDFYTSPCVHPAFGEIIGRFIKRSSELVDAKNFTVVEMGAGKGYLALDILDSIKSNYPELYTNLRYLVSETSPAQIEDGKKLLSDHNKRVSWIDSISDLGNSTVSGVFLSNELLDSFPFHRVKYTDHKIREIFVGLDNEEFIEIEGKPSFPEVEDYLETYGLEFLDGQEFEVRTNVKLWLSEISRILDKGLVLTIDYGFLAPELFNPSRMKGTYMCIYKHQINENPYINIGEQDITAHVDFSNIMT